MGGKTKIEWCDSTWNPVTGCLHNCEYCYARQIAKRFTEISRGYIKVINTQYGRLYELNEPETSIISGRKTPYPCGFAPTFHKYRLGGYTNKKGRNIFVCSMADLFGEWVPDEWIDAVFNACDDATQHNYIFLTKNAERYTEYPVPADINKWYGVSITSPKETERFNYLPAFANTFVSIEPLLEDLNVQDCDIMFKLVDWFIIGAETGRRKDKVVPKRKWIEDIINMCDKFGKPIFMKESLVPIVGEGNMRRELPWD